MEEGLRTSLENEVLFRASDRCYKTPSDFKEEERLEQRIHDHYIVLIKEKGEIPSVPDIYSKIWMTEFGILVGIAKEVTETYAVDNLSGSDLIRFYDEEFKDVVNSTCTTINNYFEMNGYRYDISNYIKQYISALGYSIYENNLRVDMVKIVSGDAQLLMPYRFSWPCATIGKNVLIDMNVRGGILLHE